MASKKSQEKLLPANSIATSFYYPKNKSLKSFWRSFGIVNDLRKNRIEIFHGLSNEIPYGLKKSGIASVVTIHDLIFYRYPQYYPWFDRKIYEFKVRLSTLGERHENFNNDSSISSILGLCMALLTNHG